MKILHTADWHLGKKLDNFSRLEEQIEVLAEICEIAENENVDAVIIAGDLFDAFNPPVEAVELFYKTLKRLSNHGRRPVIAIAGNHDSPDRIDAPDSLARSLGIIFVGYPNALVHPFELESGLKVLQSTFGFVELKLPNTETPLRLILTPYANEIRLKRYLGIEDKVREMNIVLQENWKEIADEYCDNKGVNILVSHLYMLKRNGEILEEPDGEKPLNIGNADAVYSDLIPPQIQYTALGHLHRCHEIGGHTHPVMYSSSPLCYSFSEAGQQKYIVLINAEAGRKVEITKHPLYSGRALHRKKFDKMESAVSWLKDNPNTLVELTYMSDEFMKPSDLKILYESHDGIINILPVIIQSSIQELNSSSINLEQNMQDLFCDYFSSKTGQKPHVELLELFQEVLNPSEN